MSMLGAFASGIAGGAQAIANQAGGDIDKGNKLDIAKQTADIQEQMQLRMEAAREKTRMAGRASDFAFDNDASNVNARATTADTLAKAAGKTAQSVEADRFGNTMLSGLRRASISEDAAAATQNEIAAVRTKAGDKGYTSDLKTLALADPVKAAQIAASMASAGASAAQTARSKFELQQLGEVAKVATTVRGLQADLAAAADEPTRSEIQRKIGDLSNTGKDLKGFLSIAEKAMTNGDAALKILGNPDSTPEAKEQATRQLAQANDFATKAAAQAGIKLTAPAQDAKFLVPGAKSGAGNDPYAKVSSPGGKADAKPTKAQPIGSEGIKSVPAGYGTGSYMFDGKYYKTLGDAQKAKQAYDRWAAADFQAE